MNWLILSLIFFMVALYIGKSYPHTRDQGIPSFIALAGFILLIVGVLALGIDGLKELAG